MRSAHYPSEILRTVSTQHPANKQREEIYTDGVGGPEAPHEHVEYGACMYKYIVCTEYCTYINGPSPAHETHPSHSTMVENSGTWRGMGLVSRHRLMRSYLWTHMVQRSRHPRQRRRVYCSCRVVMRQSAWGTVERSFAPMRPYCLVDIALHRLPSI